MNKDLLRRCFCLALWAISVTNTVIFANNNSVQPFLEEPRSFVAPIETLSSIPTTVTTSGTEIVLPEVELNSLEIEKRNTELIDEAYNRLFTLSLENVGDALIRDFTVMQVYSDTRAPLDNENLSRGSTVEFVGVEKNEDGEWVQRKKTFNAPEGALVLDSIDLDLEMDSVFLKISHPEFFSKIIDVTADIKTKSSIAVSMIRNPNINEGEYNNHLTLGESGYDSILKDNILNRAGGGFEGYEEGSGGNEERILRNFFSGENGIVKIVLRVLGTIGILYVLIGGLRYIFSNGDAENAEKAKDQIVWAGVGLVLLTLAEFIGFEFINPYDKDVLGNEVANSLNSKITQIIRLLEYIVGGLFLINGVVSAYNLITSRGQDENLDNEKNFIQTFIWGAGFILFAEVLVRIVASDASREKQISIITSEIGGIINFMLTFFAGASTLMLIIAALYYAASFGDEERASSAKNLIRNSAIAFVIAFSSYAIAQFLIV